MSEKTTSRVLVIGDLHEPFTLDGYLEHCKKQYDYFNCDTVVFIGDVIDNNFTSYHETSTETMGGDGELELAIRKVQKWYEVFPEAYITIGNHCRLVMRKAQTGGIPKLWIKDFNEVLGTPGWVWVHDVVIDNVRYQHGEGGTAKNRIKTDRISTVQGHLHTQGYIEYATGYDGKVMFGVQVGCGIDKDSYAMAYAKTGKTPFLACGIVLDGDKPILIPFDPNKYKK